MRQSMLESLLDSHKGMSRWRAEVRGNAQARFGERRLEKEQPRVETSSAVYSTYRWSNGGTF